MSIRIRYAYLHGQVWMYRRNYPEDVAVVLGRQALKRSLKTSDPKVARTRATEVNAIYDDQIVTVRQNLPRVAQSGPLGHCEAPGWG